jgi:hypothetical protein
MKEKSVFYGKKHSNQQVIIVWAIAHASRVKPIEADFNGEG